MRRRSRTDRNQQDIVGTLRRLGATVQDLHTVGGGFPDVLVGYMGENILVEIKEPGRKLKPVQEEWKASWRGGTVVVLHSDEEALALIRRVGAALTLIDKAVKDYQRRKA